MRATHAHVAHFLAKLGQLCAGSMDVQSAVAKAEAYAPLLAQEFDADAFCPDCLQAVAARCKFFPAYGELCGYIRDWRRATKPFVTALPAPVEPDREPPSPELKAIVSALAGQARGILAEALEEKRRGSRPVSPPRTQYLGEGAMLAIYEAKAGEGGPFAELAALRAAALRAKMLRDADQQVREHYERQWAEQSQREDA